jgi:hypothetical protein
MVSGGGSTKVATGELFAESAVVRRVEADTEDWLSQVKRIRSLAPDSHGEWMHMNGNSDFVVVDRAIREIRDDATELAGALDAAAEAYGTIENHLQRLFRSVGADVGWSASRRTCGCRGSGYRLPQPRSALCSPP